MAEKQRPRLNLLKKGQKGIIRIIFSRMGIIVLLLALNILMLLAAFAWFGEFLPHLFGGTALFTVCMVLVVINSRMDPTAKITWLIVIMLLPIFGSLFYLFTCNDFGHKAFEKKLRKIYSASEYDLGDTASEELKNKSVGAYALTKYTRSVTGIPVSQNGGARYFKSGEEMLETMLDELEKAEKSIYLEYFILDEGIMWGRILAILARKAAEGVDVRVMYDGTCEFYLLPKAYPKKLGELGIKCRVFAPVTPFLSTHYNYRDHRKIMSIDSRVAFTGGVNLADEYINEKQPYGYWKDSAIMLSGEAAESLERMFLQAWQIEDRELSFPAPNASQKSSEPGYVMPYFEDPLDDEQVARQIYIDMLNRAEQNVYIMTPYLIMDGEMESALKYAAKRGVDVRMLLPSVADHKMAHILAKSHFPALVESGVKIYEYTPGFVHAKVVVSDGREAVVGTANFDYRSLYHHFECGVYLYGVPCIDDITSDFEECIGKSSAVTAKTMKKDSLFYKIGGKVLKVIAPLL